MSDESKPKFSATVHRSGRRSVREAVHGQARSQSSGILSAIRTPERKAPPRVGTIPSTPADAPATPGSRVLVRSLILRARRIWADPDSDVAIHLSHAIDIIDGVPVAPEQPVEQTESAPVDVVEAMANAPATSEGKPPPFDWSDRGQVVSVPAQEAAQPTAAGGEEASDTGAVTQPAELGEHETQPAAAEAEEFTDEPQGEGEGDGDSDGDGDGDGDGDTEDIIQTPDEMPEGNPAQPAP